MVWWRIGTLGIKRCMHKDQHVDKNGRESQRRLTSKPKDPNAIEEDNFCHFVLYNGEILRS